jgi:hypothetical protein
MSGEGDTISNAQMIWGAEKERVVLLVELNNRQRALLRWRPGDEKAQVHPLSGSYSASEHFYATPSGEVFQVLLDGALKIRRFLPDGTEKLSVISAPKDPKVWNLTVYEIGERSNGELFLHWGDNLLLFAKDLSRPPRAYQIESLLERKTEWAGAAVYLEQPESVWIGLDGRGRSFVRVDLAQVEKLAKPWPEEAEGVGDQKPGTAQRLHGATTIVPAGKALLTIGGSALRRLAPGARRWEIVHAQPGDNLYRVAADETGRVLATWEKDPFIHVFTAGGAQHSTLPKPAALPTDVRRVSLDGLALAENGRDALVTLRGERRGERCSTTVHAAYRVPLDGKAPPQLLFETTGGYLMRLSPQGALYAVGESPDPRCDRKIVAIVSFEVSDGGVKQTTLLTSDQLPQSIEKAMIVRGSDRENLAVMIGFRLSRQRALVRWRPGTPKPDVLMLDNVVSGMAGGASLITRGGDFIDVTTSDQDELLEVRRHTPDGRVELTQLKALKHIDLGVHGLGQRPNGDLWVHWGDHLALLSKGKPTRSHDLSGLVDRRTEWAGVDVYVPAPEESLWLGLEVGAGRHFTKVRFADLEARARSW